MKKQLRYFMTLLLMMAVSVGWCETVVKWVETAPENLKTGDVVVIVDKHSLKAMSNNQGTEEAPTAKPVTLSNDKSEITYEIATTLQWDVTADNGTYQFSVTNKGKTNYMYCIDINNGIRVGDNDGDRSKFVIKRKSSNKANSLYNTLTKRYLGVYKNQDWRCYNAINEYTSVTVTTFYKKVESVPVNDKGTATYVTTNALNFSGITDVKAYVATAQDGSNVTFTRVEGAVPAGTPLLVKGKTTDVPVIASATAPEKNLLVAGTGERVASETDSKYNFILNAPSGTVGFYHAAGMTVAANRAYLSLSDNPFPSTESDAKLNAIFSDGETTGINNVNVNDNVKIFNLAGQQMKGTVKGIYIKNGKKFVK